MLVCRYFTLELITLFVNRVFRISAFWFISQIHEKASLVKSDKQCAFQLHQLELGGGALWLVFTNCSSRCSSIMKENHSICSFRRKDKVDCCESLCVGVCACIFSPHLSTLERKEQRLELSSSGTMSILCWTQY